MASVMVKGPLRQREETRFFFLAAIIILYAPSWASFARNKWRGVGDNWDIKLLNATNCDRGRREYTEGVCVVTVSFLKNEGHCGFDFRFLSSSVYCTCSEYLNVGRE